MNGKVKKIITKAWLAIMVLNTWSLSIPSSNRTIILIDDPDILNQNEKMK